MADVPRPDRLHYEEHPRDLAETERSSFAARLELSELKSRHRRDERARDFVARGKLYLFGLVAILTGIAILAFGWHFLAPEWLHWLCEETLADIRTFICSVGVAGGAASYLRSYSGCE